MQSPSGEHFWQQILDSVEDHIAVIDDTGIIVATNRSWRQFSASSGGVRASSDVGTNYLDVSLQAAAAGDETARFALAGIQDVLNGRKAKFELEYPCHSPLVKRWYILRATPLGPDRRHVVVAHIDITRRRLAEEAQRELLHQREEWTSLIAHDLRQPVTTISGYAQRLLRDVRLSDEQRRASLVNIAQSADQLKRMTEDLLDVSRIEGCRLTLNRELDDVGQLLGRIADRLRQSFPDREIRLVVGDSAPTLWVDPGRIEQIVTNLVTNAVKYGDPNSGIDVELRRAPGEVVVSVTNRGPMIPPEVLPSLFERFYRSPEATTGRQQGLGLGLYIAKHLVESHGGRIWAESNVDQTTMSFTLPCAETG
jgi:signal transduction histidine kinase